MSTSEPAGPNWPGQAALRRATARMGATGRVPSALLVVGMRGLPSAPYADALAWALICRAPADGRACGSCVECRLLRAGTHPDLRLVRQEGTQVRIDAVREAVAWAAYRPQSAAVRVVRLEGADRMGNEAAVAALKAVEEPGADVHWVLSADAPGRVHVPLRSRCVALTLRTVPEPEIRAWLVGLGVDASSAAALATEAGGFPEDAWRAAGFGVEADAPDGAGEDVATTAHELRRRLHADLRAGRIDGSEARALLNLWALAEQGIRRASPPGLIADVLHAAAQRLPPPPP